MLTSNTEWSTINPWSDVIAFMSLENPPRQQNASDPHATFVGASCIDLLLIEMVPTISQLANDPYFRNRDGENESDEEEEKEVARRRLESIGYRVGQGLVERYANQA